MRSLAAVSSVAPLLLGCEVVRPVVLLGGVVRFGAGVLFFVGVLFFGVASPEPLCAEALLFTCREEGEIRSKQRAATSAVIATLFLRPNRFVFIAYLFPQCTPDHAHVLANEMGDSPQQ